MLKYRGRSTSVVLTERMVMIPRYIPVPPIPRNARPMMKALMLGAAPHKADAAIKTVVPPMKSFLAEKVPYALDQGNVLAAEVNAKAAASQGTRSTLPKFVTMAGWMVATMVVSRA